MGGGSQGCIEGFNGEGKALYNTVGAVCETPATLEGNGAGPSPVHAFQTTEGREEG